MKKRPVTPAPAADRRRRGHRVALALLALGSQSGCTREFYREWANSDVTEAVYEKSRDPRYRLDMFSIDPPAYSRFADPSDPDRPPAPPDDAAAEALSPVPQYPQYRLMMPMEGTGYLRMLDEGPRYQSPPPPKPKPRERVVPLRPVGAPPPTLEPGPFNPIPAAPGAPTPPNLGAPAGTPPANPTGPGASVPNSGTGPVAMSPTSPRGERPTTPAPTGTRDDGLRLAATQDPASTMPTQTPTQRRPETTTQPNDAIQTPRLPLDPNPVDPSLRDRRDQPGRNLTPEQQRAQAALENIVKNFIPAPEDIPFDEGVAAGLPPNSNPYILSMEKAFQIGIVNARVYQYQLENIYINALPVTLQRFSFQPQFVAGLSPLTGVGGAGAGGGVGGGTLPTVSPANSFIYDTRATGAQTSTLSYGTVAGVGKLFDNGAKVLASFASSIVFNFVGKNPLQPTVKSYLPFQAVVPFLRGGGRAVTLEALTLAERNLLYSIRSFAVFRQQFVVATLTGGTEVQFGTSVSTAGFSASSGNADPAIGFLNVVEDVQIVENNVRNVAVFERFAEVYKELIEGESSGLTKLQLDQINQQVQGARSSLLSFRTTYRNDLDNFKIQLGMPPDTPIVIDRSRTAGFKKVFEDIERWGLSDRRELADLDGIVARLPDLEDLVIDGRSCQEVFSQDDERNFEDLLVSSERIALENRLDLMNARAQLYDTWRQIRVSANALKGYLNVAVTNQFLTPPTTNNPFGFVDQAKQFSLVLNAELPLVRVAERNNFRTALINYQRQRRTLQNTEDFLKEQLRSEIRQMQQLYLQYLITEKNLVLSIRLRDQAFEQILAPPAPSAGGNQAALQTTNLISFQSSVIQNESQLVTIWYQYQLYRLQVYRDLGILPFDEWEAFDEIFPPSGSNRGANADTNPQPGAGPRPVGGPAGPGAGVAAPAGRP